MSSRFHLPSLCLCCRSSFITPQLAGPLAADSDTSFGYTTSFGDVSIDIRGDEPTYRRGSAPGGTGPSGVPAACMGGGGGGYGSLGAGARDGSFGGLAAASPIPVILESTSDLSLHASEGSESGGSAAGSHGSCAAGSGASSGSGSSGGGSHMFAAASSLEMLVTGSQRRSAPSPAPPILAVAPQAQAHGAQRPPLPPTHEPQTAPRGPTLMQAALAARSASSRSETPECGSGAEAPNQSAAAAFIASDTASATLSDSLDIGSGPEMDAAAALRALGLGAGPGSGGGLTDVSMLSSGSLLLSSTPRASHDAAAAAAGAATAKIAVAAPSTAASLEESAPWVDPGAGRHCSLLCFCGVFPRACDCTALCE